jgi:hypothetical protein
VLLSLEQGRITRGLTLDDLAGLGPASPLLAAVLIGEHAVFHRHPA